MALGSAPVASKHSLEVKMRSKTLKAIAKRSVRKIVGLVERRESIEQRSHLDVHDPQVALVALVVRGEQ